MTHCSYVIVGILYALVGAVGYLGFADAYPAEQCAYPAGGVSSCATKSNFFDMFGTDFKTPSDTYAFTARVSLLFQLFTVFPLLLLIIRTQVFGLIYGDTYPSYAHVAGLNFLMMGISFILAALDIQISFVLGFVGAIGGFVIVFAVPVAIDFVRRRQEDKLGVVNGLLYCFILGVGVLFLALQFIPVATL
jgi:sodium-coupled neutral amino acid transporter 9